MQIIVCIKQVLDTEEITKAKVDPSTNTLIREGVSSIINSFDENALKEPQLPREQSYIQVKNI